MARCAATVGHQGSSAGYDRCFNDEGVEYLVVGAAALIPRGTEDLDFFYEMKKDTVRPQDRADADRLRRKFKLE